MGGVPVQKLIQKGEFILRVIFIRAFTPHRARALYRKTEILSTWPFFVSSRNVPLQ